MDVISPTSTPLYLTGVPLRRLLTFLNKGMPRLQRRGHGDLYVEVRIVTPEDLNEEQREALETFAEAGGEEIDVEQGFFEKLKNTL